MTRLLLVVYALVLIVLLGLEYELGLSRLLVPALLIGAVAVILSVGAVSICADRKI